MSAIAVVSYLEAGALPVHGSFTDGSVVLVRPDDYRAAPSFYRDPTSSYAHQHQFGPTIITIGPDASHSSLVSTSERYGITLADLMTFRARQR